MGHSVDDLEFFMATVSALKPWNYDQSASGLPWNTTLAHDFTTRPLRIGVLPEDSEYVLQPPVRRAIDSAVAKLKAAGHTIVSLEQDETRSIGLGARIAFTCYSAGHTGGLEKLAEDMKEPLVKSLALGVHPFSRHPPPVPRTENLGELVSSIAMVQDEYAGSWRQAWVKHDLDIVLCPGATTTAVPYDQYGVPAYTCAWNVLDVSCYIDSGD